MKETCLNRFGFTSRLLAVLGAGWLAGACLPARAATTYDFSTGLQGWTQIYPTSGDLWGSDFGWPGTGTPGSLGSLGHLGAGWNDANTQMGRSPQFKLDGSGDLVFQVFGSASSLAHVNVTPATVPEQSIDSENVPGQGGFSGLCLRDVATDTYVLSLAPSVDNYDNFVTLRWTVAQLAPYANNGKWYTLDWVDYDKDLSSYGAGWNWLVNVSIPAPPPPPPPSTNCDLLAFGTNVAGSVAVITTTSPTTGTVAWYVPYGTTVAALAPAYTLSALATCPQPNPGVPTPALSTTTPVDYVVTAQDGLSTRSYSVTVTVAAVDEPALIWNGGDGAWDLATANWTGQTSGSLQPFFTAANLIFTNFNGSTGGTIDISGSVLPASTTVCGSGTYTFTGDASLGNTLAGGTLTVSGPRLNLYTTPANLSSVAVDGGTLYLQAAGYFAKDGATFSLNKVTVGNGGTLIGERAYMQGNLLTMNGGRYWEDNGFAGGWNGPVYLAADSFFGQNGWCCNQTLNGEVSGPGGLTFSSTAGAVLTLSKSNSYAGPTIVTSGTLQCNNADALGNGGALTLNAGAKANLNYTGEHVVSALTLNGVPQIAGTYGSTNSPATNKNDAYFAGAGVVKVVTLSPLKQMLSFSFGALGDATINGTNITLLVPLGTDRTDLAPTYTVSAAATGSPLPGTHGNFTVPRVYTVTAEDKSTLAYQVTVTESLLGNVFSWTNTASGNWSDAANWTNELALVQGPLASGRSSYTLNFDADGTYTATNNLSDGFLLNQLNFAGAVTLNSPVGLSRGLTFTTNGPTLPQLNQNSASAVTINVPLTLSAQTALGGTAGGQVTIPAVISGAGGLTKDGSGTLALSGANTYRGGTTVNTGSLSLGTTANNLLGTGAVTVNSSATLNLNGNGNLTNAFTFNGATVKNGNSFAAKLNGPITLAATTTFDLLTTGNMSIGGNVSGRGGLTKIGTGAGPLELNGTNTYAGPTTVDVGVLKCNNPDALGTGALSINSPGLVNLNYAGDHVVASLTLDGTEMPPGTYGSSGSGLGDDVHFDAAGTGTVTVRLSNPVLGFTRNPDGSFTLTWASAMLLEATNVMGAWTTNTTATSPFTVIPAKAVPQMYYRLQAP